MLPRLTVLGTDGTLDQTALPLRKPDHQQKSSATSASKAASLISRSVLNMVDISSHSALARRLALKQNLFQRQKPYDELMKRFPSVIQLLVIVS